MTTVVTHEVQLTAFGFQLLTKDINIRIKTLAIYTLSLLEFETVFFCLVSDYQYGRIIQLLRITFGNESFDFIDYISRKIKNLASRIDNSHTLRRKFFTCINKFVKTNKNDDFLFVVDSLINSLTKTENFH